MINKIRHPHPLMTKQLNWSCPLCVDDPPISRGSQLHLDLAIATHILHHEEKSALRAVDSARISCPHTNCEIGRKNHQNKSIGSAELNLSDFDRLLLSAMKIQGE